MAGRRRSKKGSSSKGSSSMGSSAMGSSSMGSSSMGSSSRSNDSSVTERPPNTPYWTLIELIDMVLLQLICLLLVIFYLDSASDNLDSLGDNMMKWAKRVPWLEAVLFCLYEMMVQIISFIF